MEHSGFKPANMVSYCYVTFNGRLEIVFLQVLINVVYGRGEVASPVMASRKPYLSNWKQ
jgi:hypothetical protein